MSYGIIIDSTVYLPKKLIEDKNIEVVSLYVEVVGEGTYKEKDITREFIIEKRNSGKSFKTSAPAPGEFLTAYQDLLSKNDHVFVIGLSKNLSGTYQSSVVGRNMLDNPNKVTIFDTNQSAYGNEMLVFELIEMIDSKNDSEYIINRMNKLIKQSKLMFTCENLFSLVAGGRLSNAKAMIGTVLRVKPIIEMIDGKLVLFKSERTYKKIFSLIEQKILETSKGYNNLSFYITHTYSEKSGEQLLEFIKSTFPNAKIKYTDLLGPVMTVHVGNKGFGISWMYE
jgi:DegV family protein with EDD domain